MDKSQITVERLRSSLEALQYRFFERGDFNLNLIGIRAADRHADHFNDLLCIAFKQDGRWLLLCFDCTTDPGLFWRQHPMNVNGTAVLVPGQHRAAFTLGRHKNQYPALTQAQPLPVYRDNNRNGRIDTDTALDLGWHGINIHRAHAVHTSSRVGRWSAGCQVLADATEFEILMALCTRAGKRWGTSFTYTLIDEESLV